jgi:hypothetical protein
MPKTMSHTAVLAFTALLGLSLAACGGSSMSPTGASSSSGASATIRGTVDDATASLNPSEVSMASRHSGIKVTVAETGQSTTTDGSGTFIITAPSGTATLHFQGQGIDAQLTVGGLNAGQTVTITVHVSGSHADMDDDQEGEGTHDACFASGAKAEVEGLIDAKDASSITVAQQGKGDFRCVVSASTRIRKGNRTLALTDLAVGARVHVSGTGHGASSGVCEVDATEIKLQ